MQSKGEKRSGSDRLHRRDQTEVGAARRTLSRGHLASGFRVGAAAAFLEAVEAGARGALDEHLLGAGLVARHLLFGDFDKSGLGVDDFFLTDDVVAANLGLIGFFRHAGEEVLHAEHGAAGAEAKGDGDERQEQGQVFHVG